MYRAGSGPFTISLKWTDCFSQIVGGLGPSLRWDDGLMGAPGSGINSVAEADQPGVKCVGWVQPII